MVLHRHPIDLNMVAQDAGVPAVALGAVVQGDLDTDAIEVNSLSYAYPGYKALISDFTLHIPAGSRCLLIGANGAGKTTLLQILAGKHMVGQDVVRVLGRPAFHDIELTATGELSYLGPQWRRDIAFAGTNVPLQGDIGARKMIFGVEGVDPARRQRLIDLLDIDLSWRLNKVSDGQRRRVQICLGLLKPYKVLLLDEITVDMDVVGRLDLLRFFEEECAERGATIIYATHILDFMEHWMTHVAYVASGQLVKGGPVAEVPELCTGKKLLRVVEVWLRDERDRQRREEAANPRAKLERPGAIARMTTMMPSKHMAFFR